MGRFASTYAFDADGVTEVSAAINQNKVMKMAQKKDGCFNKDGYVRIIIKVQAQPLYIKFLRS